MQQLLLLPLLLQSSLLLLLLVLQQQQLLRKQGLQMHTLLQKMLRHRQPQRLLTCPT